MNNQSLFQWHSWHVPVLQMAWISNGDYFILLGFAWTQHPTSYFLTGLQFLQSGSHFTANISEWRRCQPRIPNQWESRRVLEKAGMRERSDADTDTLGRLKSTAFPFSPVISWTRTKHFCPSRIQIQTLLYEWQTLPDKIHKPLSLALRLSSAISTKHAELNMTKHITDSDCVSSSASALCFLITSPNRKKKRKRDQLQSL